MYRQVRPVLLVLSALLASTLSLQAQTLRGTVGDGITRQPLADVQLTLVHPDGSDITSALSAADGSFTLSVPGPGDYYIKAERFTYQTIVDGILAFETEDAVLEIGLYLRPRPQVLEGIRVEVERAQTRRYLRSQGFYQRAEMGLGRFIGPEDLERRPPFNFGDVLRGIPGLRFNGDVVSFRGAGLTGSCSPPIYIDSALMPAGTPINAFVDVQDVEAVEVYRRASETPLEWGGTNGNCGAILIWTKG